VNASDISDTDISGSTETLDGGNNSTVTSDGSNNSTETSDFSNPDVSDPSKTIEDISIDSSDSNRTSNDSSDSNKASNDSSLNLRDATCLKQEQVPMNAIATDVNATKIEPSTTNYDLLT